MTDHTSCASRGDCRGNGLQQLIRYNCPTCGQRLDNPPHMAGRNDECPGCGYVHLVPEAGSARSRH